MNALQLRAVQDTIEGSTINISNRMKNTKEGTALPANAEKPSAHGDLMFDKRSNSEQLLPVSSEAVHSSEDAIGALNTDTSSTQSLGKRKALGQTNIELNDSVQVIDDLEDSSNKKQKKLLPLDKITVSSDGMPSPDAKSRHNISATNDNELEMTTKDSASEPMSEKFFSSDGVSSDNIVHNVTDEAKDVKKEPETKQSFSKGELTGGILSSSDWKPIEKELYLKGVEIFGRNRYIGFLFI